MSQETSAFQPRMLPKESAVKEGGSASQELPLKDLSTDQKNVAAFEFFFNRVISGNIPNLEFRLSIGQVDEFGFAQDASGKNYTR